MAAAKANGADPVRARELKGKGHEAGREYEGARDQFTLDVFAVPGWLRRIIQRTLVVLGSLH